MSAKTVREAADWLDMLAVRATPGPWSSGLTGVYQPEGSYVARWEDGSQTPVTADRMYIAAMHPGIGEALAALLRALSKRAEDICDATPTREFGESVAERNLPGYIEALSLAAALTPPPP